MANDILERLRHRADVFSKFKSQTEFGEIIYLYERTQERTQTVTQWCK